MGKDLIEELLPFFKKFIPYQKYTDDEIIDHIRPSYNLNQYKLFSDQEEIIGFVNWAWLNEECKIKFINHAIIDPSNWKSGENLCFANFVCSKNIYNMINWCKEHFARKLNYDKEVIWVKAYRNNRVMRVTNKWQR